MKNTKPKQLLKASADELISIIKNHEEYNVEEIILTYSILKMEYPQDIASIAQEAEILSKAYKVSSLDVELDYWMKEYWEVSSIEKLKAKIREGTFKYRSENKLLKQYNFLKILAGSAGFIWLASVLVEIGKRGPTWHHVFGLFFLVLIFAIILVAKYLKLILEELRK